MCHSNPLPPSKPKGLENLSTENSIFASKNRNATPEIISTHCQLNAQSLIVSLRSIIAVAASQHSTMYKD